MRLTISIATAVLCILISGCKQSDPAPTNTNLVWADEFLGDSLDLSKWQIQTGDGSAYGLWLWGNNEEQWYQSENITVENGFLRIKAAKQSVGDFEYTSGRIRTKNKGDFKYGRVEASMRMANTPGLWHAFWMLPSNAKESWPVSGEIDIMESVGNLPDEVLSTVHFADQFGNHNQLGASTYMLYDNNFHQYAIEWSENKITWFIDDVETYSVYRGNSIISQTWPFDAQFHLLLNTAVGGNLGGEVDDEAMQIPKWMEVDYVRVYQDQQ
jgi:beta-glucanase (GH16 family)